MVPNLRVAPQPFPRWLRPVSGITVVGAN